jgi:hypothetical protein
MNAKFEINRVPVSEASVSPDGRAQETTKEQRIGYALKRPSPVKIKIEKFDLTKIFLRSKDCMYET